MAAQAAVDPAIDPVGAILALPFEAVMRSRSS